MTSSILIERSASLSSLGASIRVARRRRGFSQEQLAAAASIDRTYLGRIERGEVNVGFVLLTSIATGLDMGLADLMAPTSLVRPTSSSSSRSSRERLSASLRALRAATGYSQGEVALLAGMNPTYIGGLERGERNVSIDQVDRLAVALDTDVGRLLSV